MSNKVSSLKSQVQVGRITDADRSRDIEETIKILAAQVESLELCYLGCEERESKQGVWLLFNV